MSLATDLDERMRALLSERPLDAARAAAIAAWLEEHFYFLSPKTPPGTKALKEQATKLHWWLKHGVAMHAADGARRTIEAEWAQIQPRLADLVRAFSAEGGRFVPKELQLEGARFLNSAGLDDKKLVLYAERLVTIFRGLKGWRRGALAGGVTVQLASPADFGGGTAGGKYRSQTDVLLVRATPDVLKRAGTAYAGFEYIVTHELGHRFERFNALPLDFDNPGWWTTPYSRTEGEAFAELFALTNFGITEAHTAWQPELNERFDALMAGAEPATENPLVAEADRSVIEALVDKYLEMLDIRGERPLVKVTSALGAGWNGRTTWSPRSPSTTTIELQRSITDDPRTLERVIAHEMIHHGEFLDMTEHDIARARIVEPESHGEAFLRGARIINREMGQDFVTVTSDKDFVHAPHTKELYVLIVPTSPRAARLGWAWAARLSPEAQEVVAAKEHEGGRLVRTTDLKWTHGKAKIKKYGGLSVPLGGSTLETELRALYNASGEHR